MMMTTKTKEGKEIEKLCGFLSDISSNLREIINDTNVTIENKDKTITDLNNKLIEKENVEQYVQTLQKTIDEKQKKISELTEENAKLAGNQKVINESGGMNSGNRSKEYDEEETPKSDFSVLEN